MAEPDRPQPEPPDHRSPAERYQIQQRSWLARADEVARLRDEVRTAAEREALDIVAGARRNIRQVITDARRDLLVLSAQLHATLGTPILPPGPGGGSLPETLPALDVGPSDPDAPDGGATREDAERNAALRAALERARAGIDALAEELDGVELPLEPTRPAEPFAPRLPNHETATSPPRRIVEEEASVRGVPWRPSAELTPHADAPAGATGDRDRRLVLGVALAAAILLTTGIVWLWPGRAADPPMAGSPPSGPIGAEAAPPSATADGVTRLDDTAAMPLAPAPGPAASAAGLSVEIAVQGPAWIRTTVDGTADAGRMYGAGDTLRLDGNRSVALRVGDAGAVTVSVNGGPMEVLGPEGAVVNREFSASRDAVSPTPAPQELATAPQAPAATPPPPAAGAVPAPAPPASAASPASPPSDTIDLDAAAAEAAALEASSVWVPEVNIVTAAQEWHDAYHLQDARAMATVTTEQTTVADERRAVERFPPGTEGVQRQFDAVSVEFAGDTAIYTARMLERRTGPGAATEEHAARVAQIWTRRGGRWQLTDVRILSEARLGQLVR
jgi:ketosteroid isomerase-like protein